MKEGLLLYVNRCHVGHERLSLEDRVRIAVRQYRKKHGVYPNRCYVAEGILDNEEPITVAVDGARALVLSSKVVSPDYFWVGIGTEDET